MGLEGFGSTQGRAKESFLVDRWAQGDTLEEAGRALLHHRAAQLGRGHVEEGVFLLSDHLLGTGRRALGREI